MFSRISTKRSTSGFSAQIARLRRALDEADAVVIGAGAGLSTAAGFTHSGARFERCFSDFAAKYGFHDMYSGGFYSFPSQEKFWAYWSRYIFINRYQNAPKSVHEVLLELVRDKDYFVITTNVDHCFQKAGFDKKHLFYTQGDYGLFQCSEPCCQETFDNEKTVRRDGRSAGLHRSGRCADAADRWDANDGGTVGAPSGLPALRQTDDDEPALRRTNLPRTRAGTPRRSGTKISPHAGRTKDPLLELGVGYNTPVFRSLRTGNKRTKTLRKQRILGHLQILTTNYQERLYA